MLLLNVPTVIDSELYLNPPAPPAPQPTNKVPDPPPPPPPAITKDSIVILNIGVTELLAALAALVPIALVAVTVKV
jgi:hypothetical protein